MMSNHHVCRARQVNDQMMCSLCRLQWDVNDPEPPKCHEPKTHKLPKGKHLRRTVKPNPAA